MQAKRTKRTAAVVILVSSKQALRRPGNFVQSRDQKPGLLAGGAGTWVLIAEDAA